jgi:F420-0:gamma-glutamyl ligase
MTRTIGTQIRAIRAPIIKQGDDLVEVVVNTLQKSWGVEGYCLGDRDVIGITESTVARSQGNYVTVDQIAQDISQKYNGELGVVFPILSRNRFSILLKAIARAVPKVHLLLSYPADEVGNHLMDIDKLDELGINPYTDVLSEADYRRLFGAEVKHPFTGIDYVQFYKNLGVNDNISVHLANDPRVILQFTKNVLAADIHTRERTKRILRQAGAETVYSLDDICTKSIDGSGYNPEFGLLGSNMSSDEKVKLFPRDGQAFVNKVQARLKEVTGKHVEVMIYGDGAFKDPAGKIWELADPVVSPGFTDGLRGTPNELKLKYLADNQLKDLCGEEAKEAMKQLIKTKKENLVGTMDTQGTTPRQLTDLLGSLCDLTSGSGDKGTPIIVIQGYFDNYATD